MSMTTIANSIPDVLTMMRVVFAVILVGFGLDGQPNLVRDIWLLVGSWTSDMVDGKLSRSLKKRRTSWLGKQDVYIDMFVSASALFYLTATGVLRLWVSLLYLVIWGILFLRCGIPPLFAQVFQNPIYAAFVFFAVRAQPSLLLWLLLWAALMLAIFWRRGVELYQDAVRFIRRQ